MYIRKVSRYFTLVLLLLQSYLLHAQDNKSLFGSLEFKVSAGIGYHNSFSELERNLAQACIEYTHFSEIDRELIGARATDQLPFQSFDVSSFSEGGVFKGLNLNKLKSEYFRYYLEGVIHFNTKGFGKNGSLGLYLGQTRFYQRTAAIQSMALFLVIPGTVDSVLVSWNSDPDTVLQIPGSRIINYSMTLSSLDFGMNYRVQALGESNSKWRVFLKLGYRMRLLSGQTILQINYPDYTSDPFIYEGYSTFNEQSFESASVTLLNAGNRTLQQYQVSVPGIIAPAVNFGLCADWKLLYFPVYLGLECDFAVQAYKIRAVELSTGHNLDFRLYLCYQPALRKEWNR